MSRARHRLLLASVSVAAAFVLLASVAMAASSATWEGITWGAVSGTDIDVVDGNLIVTDNNGSFPAAHYNTSVAFRNSPSQSVSFTMIDGGVDTVAGGVYIEYESAQWAGLTLGAGPGYDNYMVYWYNAAGADVLIDTHVRRTAGEHSFEVGLRDDGTVDFWIDGRRVVSAPDFGLEYIGDVYLRARGGADGDTVTYTSYAEGTYAVPTSKVECKNGGWQDFSNPAFKNQGQCVSFVMTTGN